MHYGRLTLDKVGHQQGHGTIRRALNFVARIINRDDSRKLPPSPRSQHPNGEFCLTQAQLRRLVLAGRTPRDRTMIQLFCETGMRRAEVAALRIEDCRLADRVLVVRHGKGNKMRLVPLTLSMVTAVSALTGPSVQGPVFASSNGGHISLRQVNRIVADAGYHADILNPNPKYDHVTCHLLRHSFARHWKAKGGSIESLSKILGHSSPAITLTVYGRESLTDVRRNYDTTMRRVFPQDTSDQDGVSI